MNIIKNIKKNTILLLIITGIVLYIVLKDDFNDIVDILTKIDIKYILLAILFYALFIVIKGYVNYKITNDKKKLSLKEAIKHNIITQFFNGVTPFSTGGQPMEVYMLMEHDIPIAKATNQTIQSFIFYQIALVICGSLAVINNFLFPIFPKVRILQLLVLLGFAINVFVVVVLILISRSKRVTNKLSELSIKVLKKLKRKVDEEDIKQKFSDYHEGFKELRKRKKLFVGGVVLNIISLLCLYIVPLFILYSMKDFTSLDINSTITASAYVYIIGGFVPIPGASGGIEYGFTRFFGNFITGHKLSAVLLLWRFITYYVGVIIGALVFNFEKKVDK
ncbi:MAG: flippase-like domain-containing protein [Bacilli bacterium]|nr:flippase-like domain-containing protein [Bacilli bacterium]